MDSSHVFEQPSREISAVGDVLEQPAEQKSEVTLEDSVPLQVDVQPDSLSDLAKPESVQAALEAMPSAIQPQKDPTPGADTLAEQVEDTYADPSENTLESLAEVITSQQDQQ